jgi:hypothetical protein
MNPLESIVVALRPMQQDLPWSIPNSIRPLDTTQPVGSALPNEFTNVDPTNQPAAVTNALVNFGDEYVWHCHILGHEENDMMRAMIMLLPPAQPISVTATSVGSGNTVRVNVGWTPGSQNASSYTILRATVTGGLPGAFNPIGTVNYPLTTFTDTTGARRTTYAYQVIANNVVGYTRTYAPPAAGYPSQGLSSAATQSGNVTTQ